MCAVAHGVADSRQWDMVPPPAPARLECSRDPTRPTRAARQIVQMLMIKQPEWMRDIEEADRLTGMEPATWDDRYSINFFGAPDDAEEAEIPSPVVLRGAAGAGADGEGGEEEAPATMTEAEWSAMINERMKNSVLALSVLAGAKEAAEKARAAIARHKMTPAHVERDRSYRKLLADLAIICEDAIEGLVEPLELWIRRPARGFTRERRMQETIAALCDLGGQKK
eukprot:tig00020956_g16523.t1